MTTNPAAEASHLVTRILHLPITSDADVFGTVAQATERVVVALPDPTREHIGRLEAFVLGAIEHELERRGAAPPGWQRDEGLEAKLGDQLYRTRLLGAGGLALRFSRLDAIADEACQLNADDSDTLRQLLALAEREPLQLYLPQSVAALLVVGEPRRLSDWLTTGSKAGAVATIEYEPAEPSGEATSTPGADLWAPPAVEAFVASPTRVEGTANAREDVSSGVTPAAGSRTPDPQLQPAAQADAEAASHGFTPPPQGNPQNQRCAAWMAQLQNMSGPKVHGSVERAFLTAYLPLSREVATGRAPRETQVVVEKWAEGFAQSYATAFKSLNLRAKRPKMVRDVVDVGVRWLGQHRARQCQLLLVSGMRFDLGQRLNEEIEKRLQGRAVCADQTILWAALPSNGESQHVGDAPARSPRSPSRLSSDSATPSSAIESLRLGTRELFRLDQIAGDLAKTGEPETLRLQRLATALAEHVVPWMSEQPPETLIVIFGDHGFHWQTSETGTSAAQRGGALPEQVLVPASAWLVGEARASKARVAPGVH